MLRAQMGREARLEVCEHIRIFKLSWATVAWLSGCCMSSFATLRCHGCCMHICLAYTEAVSPRPRLSQRIPNIVLNSNQRLADTPCHGSHTLLLGRPSGGGGAPRSRASVGSTAARSASTAAAPRCGRRWPGWRRRRGWCWRRSRGWCSSRCRRCRAPSPGALLHLEFSSRGSALRQKQFCQCHRGRRCLGDFSAQEVAVYQRDTAHGSRWVVLAGKGDTGKPALL